MSETGQLVPLSSAGTAMLFAALPAALAARLRDRAPARRFAEGQVIQQRGETARGFWLIEEGAVAVGQFLADGDFRQVALLGPGDSYGELAWLAARRRVVDAVAREAAVLRHIDGARFERALAEDPAAMRRLLGAMAGQLQEVLNLMAGIRRGTATARAAGLLANLCGPGAAPRRLAVTQQEIADLLGVTRSTAHQALRELDEGGLIGRRYGAIEVPDPDRLRRFAAG
ncbi:Crp/Fnr family transcriptional regulator [Pelagerythrobacter marinus]|uniref:Crp/Fnr family transcriptional regulator n=1 Tax=Pelagerythrobacter marinus TaxID=538382 RepID=UPI00203762A3|nr:Crp/Fnr family transcriptional regulator [Pelagerythrobacter marinus]USA39010.1 Crp/Fnr family transcriptional regulator [Pelagerythrobacter marinus]WPZ06905.1 Crp/Fnr family transcriptional regulator [Pelagerythrobacter marinus]